MKLRIKGNSVRVRLAQGETANLGGGKKVEQITEFPGNRRLISSIEVSRTAAAISADFTDGCVRIVLPLTDAQTWAFSDAVSLESTIALGASKSLIILVEKDFQCLHSAADENADAFPNPRK